MEMRNTSCCAIQEIVELRGHPDPEEAMFSFCRQNILQRPKFQNPKVDPAPIQAAVGEIYCFYMFTANIDAGNYGPNFAKFIKDHDLGELRTTTPRPNNAFHGGGRCQVWLWEVDQAAIRKWWEANKSRSREVHERGRSNGSVDVTRST